MTGPQFDWTLEDVPEDSAPRTTQRVDPLPNILIAAPPRPWAKPRWGRRHFLLLGLCCALLGGGSWLYWQIGWWRLQDQVLTQVRYEDERAQAQDTAAVVAAQAAGDVTWRSIRAAETEYGWAAPLPAPNLLPLNEPAQLQSLETAEEGVFTATVVRAFSDAAGVRYQFAFIQKYRNLQPGVWERLSAGPVAPTRKPELWEGSRLRVLHQAREIDWVTKNAPALDALLVRACAHWECPARQRLSLIFADDLAHWPKVIPPVRAPDLPQEYPLIFDLPIAYGATTELTLSSPWLTGYPQDPPAETLYFRTIAVALLAQLADNLSLSSRTPSNYFLDALIAQEEIALGLTAAPDYPLTPATFIPPERLWRNTSVSTTPSQESIHLRLQALRFLTEVGPAPTAEQQATLLATLHRQGSLPEWLQQTFAESGRNLVERWEQAALTTLAKTYPPDWATLQGLLYTCGSASPTLITTQGPQTLPVQSLATPSENALAPDGQSLAVFQPRPNRQTPELQIFDLTTQTFTPVQPRPLPANNSIFLLGWAANGDLWYLDNNYREASSIWLDSYPSRLMRYTPQTGTATSAAPNAYFFALASGPSPWNPERTQLVLPQITFQNGQVQQTYAFHLTLFPTPTATTLNIAGFFPLFRPQHAEVIYTTNNFFTPSNAPTALIQHNLQTGLTQTLLTSQDLPFGQAQDSLALIAIAPDGEHLIFNAFIRDYSQSYLFSFTTQQFTPLFGKRSTQPFSWINFSPQGRYLSALTESSRATASLQVLDLNTPYPYLYWRAEGEALTQFDVWDPAEQWLVINGPAGFYVTNPTTQDFQWLTTETCLAASWH